MPDFVTGAMAVTSLISAKAGHDAANRSNDTASQSLAFERDKLAYDKERDAFNRGIVEQNNQINLQEHSADRNYAIDRRDRNDRLIDPIQEGIIARANQGPDFEGAASRSDADVAQAYGLQREQEMRRQSRYGINPASGVAGANAQRLDNAEALARVHGRNRSRLQEDDRDWARKIAALGTGNKYNTMPGLNMQQLGASQTTSGVSNTLNNQSANQASNASGAFALSGKLFANAADRYGEKPNTPPKNNYSGWTDPSSADGYGDYAGG